MGFVDNMASKKLRAIISFEVKHCFLNQDGHCFLFGFT